MEILEDEEIDDIEEDFLEKFEKDEKIQSKIKEIGFSEFLKETNERLHQNEELSLAEYQKETKRLLNLKNHSEECEANLNEMLFTVQNFLKKIGEITKDLSGAKAIKRKYERTKQVGNEISHILVKSIISPRIIFFVFKEDINSENYENYLEVCLQLNEKYNYLVYLTRDKKMNKEKVNTFGKELLRICKLLIMKSCQRVKEFISSKLQNYLKTLNKNVKMQTKTRIITILNNEESDHSRLTPKKDRNGKKENLKVPINVSVSSNTQYFKQEMIFKHKLFLVYLKKFDTTSYIEIMDQYILIFENYYLENFKDYFYDLQSFRKNTKGAKNHPISLKSQEKELENDEKILRPIMPSYLSEKETFFFEEIWQSMLILLIDAVSSEFVFGLEFFITKSFDLFLGKLFKETLKFFKNEILAKFIKRKPSELEVLNVMKLNNQFSKILKKRTIDCLDSYFRDLNSVLITNTKLNQQ